MTTMITIGTNSTNAVIRETNSLRKGLLFTKFDCFLNILDSHHVVFLLQNKQSNRNILRPCHILSVPLVSHFACTLRSNCLVDVTVVESEAIKVTQQYDAAYQMASSEDVYMYLPSKTSGILMSLSNT